MTEVAIERRVELDALTRGAEQLLASAAAGPAWLIARRREALNRANELGLPTSALEDWKYTAVGRLAKAEYETVTESSESCDLTPFTYWERDAWRIVFVDGVFRADLSALGGLPTGVVVDDLFAAATDDDFGVDSVRDINRDDCAFRSLSLALATAGAYVSIPDGVVLDRPIHILSLAGRRPFAQRIHLTHLLRLGRRASARVVERYGSVAAQAENFTNVSVDVELAANATFDHYRVQRESRQATHLSSVRVRQFAGSSLRQTSISAGASLSRSDVATAQMEEGTHCDLAGLYVADGQSHVDQRVLVHHSRSHGSSQQLFKGVLDDAATAIFNGRIIADEGTKGTTAHQVNRNLLLADGAVANTRPQLEIYADDIQCSHGATVGRLDDDALFYLRSRGISLSRARSLLTFAFAADVVERIAIDELRSRAAEFLADRMERGHVESDR